MPSEYSKLLRSVWSDPEWLELSSETQRMYLLLLSQPTISYAGVIALSPRRWSNMAKDGSLARVKRALTDLTNHAYVVADDASEELLVRSYVRHDYVLGSPNMVKALCAAVRAIQSAHLRDCVIGELARLVSEADMDTPPKGFANLLKPKVEGGLGEAIDSAGLMLT